MPPTGVDYLKYDNCFAPAKDWVIDRYAAMRNALNATGRPIIYSLCEWGVADPWTWAPQARPAAALPPCHPRACCGCAAAALRLPSRRAVCRSATPGAPQRCAGGQDCPGLNQSRALGLACRPARRNAHHFQPNPQQPTAAGSALGCLRCCAARWWPAPSLACTCWTQPALPACLLAIRT